MLVQEEKDFATALSRAIAEDLRANPAAGALVRVVVRWFDEADPLNLSVHTLGSVERPEVWPEHAWSPLEWENLDEEGVRSCRVMDDPDVWLTAEALAAVYQASPPERDYDRWTPSPAITEAVRQLLPTLRAARVPLEPDFAASAAHFEGMGALAVLEDLAAPDLLAGLAALGELPTE
ncbi:hypothetical protein DFR70_101785 [Nocardia tenerifensis]|uniref:Uncharacterized protein n=1 Tax=Nocardia tenerifensis TaxID=228006 RepID=A0A318KGP7_9NOCA|nr:hypothetical protein [Nocardia tenerifensis]PXX71363.1 hypothetical protein DFR70_101785 [Nocardia tenerifensis]